MKPMNAPDRYARRNIPIQRRSRETLEVIKQATIELVAKDGFADLGTARIAERAGVSIGTLYHYFPSCEAILLSIYEDVTVEMASATKRILLEMLDSPPTEGLEHVFRSLLALYRRHELVLIHMVEQRPDVPFDSHPLSLGNLIVGSTKLYLLHHRPELGEARIKRMVSFIDQFALSSIRWFLAKSDEHEYGEESFIHDIAHMIVFYIDLGSPEPLPSG